MGVATVGFTRMKNGRRGEEEEEEGGKNGEMASGETFVIREGKEVFSFPRRLGGLDYCYRIRHDDDSEGFFFLSRFSFGQGVYSCVCRVRNAMIRVMVLVED